jgi:CheY-like chemotaxis protein
MQHGLRVIFDGAVDVRCRRRECRNGGTETPTSQGKWLWLIIRVVMAVDDERNRDLVQDLRRAFHHLYDPVELRKNALMAVLRLESPADLRQLLQEIVESLRPTVGVAQHSDAWRTHRVLHHRYIEQFDQQGVAANLGLSIRQLRRQEVVALQSVVDLLCVRFGLNRCREHEYSLDAHAEPRADEAAQFSRDMHLIQRTDPKRSLDLTLLVESVLETLAAKAATCGVRLLLKGFDGDVYVESVPQLVRQALLIMLPPLMERARNSDVQISVDRSVQSVRLDALVCDAESCATACVVDDSEMAGRLLVLADAELEVDTHGFAVRFASAVAATVLIIDDNEDAHLLYRRFVTHTSYRLLHAYNVSQAEALLRDITPHVVVLDVMMPDVDGWEMLGRLREHPQTMSIPVVVCTILPQQNLANTLRAAAFLRKPINAENFVATLDKLTGASAK